MKCLAEDTAVIAVDFQERMMPVIEDGETVAHNAEILLKGLGALGIPVIITQQYTKGLGGTIASIADAAGTGTWFEKMTFSCCDDMEIFKKLKMLGRKNIIVCGVESHICVLQTCIDLKSSGYQPYLVEDCIGSRKSNDKKNAVIRAVQEGVYITTYEAVLFELARRCKTDTFKIISNLIK